MESKVTRTEKGLWPPRVGVASKVAVTTSKPVDQRPEAPKADLSLSQVRLGKGHMDRQAIGQCWSPKDNDIGLTIAVHTSLCN